MNITGKEFLKIICANLRSEGKIVDDNMVMAEIRGLSVVDMRTIAILKITNYKEVQEH